MEVLPQSTADFDQNKKFDCYKGIDDFKQYILVHQEEMKVEVHEKLNAKQWLETTLTQESDQISVNDCTVLLKDIYDLNLDEEEV